MSEQNDDTLLACLDPSVAPHIGLIPDVMRAELLADDQGFITRRQMTPALASRFTPAMKALSSPDALRAVLPETAFFRSRMQPIAGAIGAVTCQRWPRFCYFPYVPLNFYLEARSEATLIVAVHGSSRSAQAQRNAFTDFAEEHGLFVLAPLFPIDLRSDVPDEEYKYLVGSGTRYDLVLLDMIAELAEAATVRFTKILLCGFSGGGQFAHRFLYVHPELVHAVSAAAPGFVTLPNERHDWWVGIRDIEAVFGKPFDRDRVRKVPVQILCNSADMIPFEIYSAQEMGMSAEDYDRYGKDRVARATLLSDELRSLGLDVRLDLVDGGGHQFNDTISAAIQAFFLKYL